MKGSIDGLSMEKRTETPDTLPEWARDILLAIDQLNDPAKIRAFVIQRATSATKERSLYRGPVAKPVGHRLYDALIEKMFTSVLRAASREAVLEMVVRELAQPELGSEALAYFVLDAKPLGPGGGFKYAVGIRSGLPDAVWHNLEEQLNSTYAGSAFLQELLADKLTIDIWSS